MNILFITGDTSPEFASLLVLKSDAVCKVLSFNGVQTCHLKSAGNLSRIFSHVVIEADFFERFDLERLDKIISPLKCDVTVITEKFTAEDDLFLGATFVKTQEMCLALLGLLTSIKNPAGFCGIFFVIEGLTCIVSVKN